MGHIKGGRQSIIQARVTRKAWEEYIKLADDVGMHYGKDRYQMGRLLEYIADEFDVIRPLIKRRLEEEGEHE